MDQEEERLLKKIRTKNNTIFKYGTYTMEDPNHPASDNNGPSIGDNIENLPPDVYMPPRTEDFIQNNIDALVNEAAQQAAQDTEDEDAKIAEIMKKFSSNIQDNVSSLFDNV